MEECGRDKLLVLDSKPGETLNLKQVGAKSELLFTLIVFTAYPDILRILLGSGICVCIGR